MNAIALATAMAWAFVVLVTVALLVVAFVVSMVAWAVFRLATRRRPPRPPQPSTEEPRRAPEA